MRWPSKDPEDYLSAEPIPRRQRLVVGLAVLAVAAGGLLFVLRLGDEELDLATQDRVSHAYEVTVVGCIDSRDAEYTVADAEEAFAFLLQTFREHPDGRAVVVDSRPPETVRAILTSIANPSREAKQSRQCRRIWDAARRAVRDD